MRTLVVAGGDSIAVAGIVMSLMGWLPPMAALVAVIWYAIQIYESRTLQAMLNKSRLRRLVQLRAKAAALELMIRGTHADVTELNEANVIHAAAIQKRQEIFEPRKEEGNSH